MSPLAWAVGLAALLAGGCGRPATPPVTVAHLTARAAPATLRAGRSVRLRVAASSAGGRAVPRAAVWAYVNGRAWGAPTVTNAHGDATVTLPLPDTGSQRLTVATVPVHTAWIWAHGARPGHAVYLARRFQLSRQATAGLRSLIATATLRVTADQSFLAYLNGKRVASGTGPQAVTRVRGLGPLLRSGSNVLAIVAQAGRRGSGVIARLHLAVAGGIAVQVRTDAHWRSWPRRPGSWPQPRGGAPVTVLAPAGGGLWTGLPTSGAQGLLPLPPAPGTALAPELLLAQAGTVQVQPAHLPLVAPPRHLVGMEYEPWFTPTNDTWHSAEAQPLLGPYTSSNGAVLRQHALWLDRAGVNFLLIDWSNNLWGKTAWSQRATNVRQIVHATTDLLNTYARMRHEGLATPQVTLLVGLDNGASTTTQALAQEMAWVRQHYVQNPAYRGLWVHYRGRPLLVVFNGGGPGFLARQAPLPAGGFTVRWMSSQLQQNQLQNQGYWSWMDGSVHPVLTRFHGRPEALTVTPAFFGAGGWTGPAAMGRRGGSTYLREFKVALRDRPRFLLINQWNEFAGQPPSAAAHVDTYTTALSDDIEPTRPAGCGYVLCGGWGFRYLDLTRALIHLYRDPGARSTLVAIGSPGRDRTVCGTSLPVSWTAIGRTATAFTLRLDGRTVATGLHGAKTTLSLAGIQPGEHTLQIFATGAENRYPLLRGALGRPLTRPGPASAAVPFTTARHCPRAVTPVSLGVPPSAAGIDLSTLATGTAGADHQPFGPLHPGQTLAEVFPARVRFVGVSPCLPTWTTRRSGATLELRAGAGLQGTVLARRTLTDQADNGCPVLTVHPARPQGTYTLELAHPRGPAPIGGPPSGAAIGWWGSARMVQGAYALINGRRQAAELTVRVVAAPAG